ncbi:hypothetical protein ACIA49_13110 [Kribbella sp. NPDC051587]|uniref:hypothetical protein n=1 Tax=Kribbella sp. NPDC051587 TaxID=3364119 RepID=UPI0037AF775D
MKRLLELAPYLAPAVVTVLLGVFGPSIRTAVRLRRDLSSDAEVVEALPEDAKNAMREDMGRRALVLIGYSRYPVMTLSDIFAGIGLLLCSGFWSYACWEYVHRGFNPETTYFSFGMSAFGIALTYSTGHARWTDRAGHRIRHLEHTVDRAQAVEAARLARIARHASGGVGFLLSSGLPFSLASTIMKRHNIDPLTDNRTWYFLLGTLAVAGLSLFLLAQVGRGSELDSVFFDYFRKEESDRMTAVEKMRAEKKAARQAARAAKKQPRTPDPSTEAQPDPHADA